jgi:hypothetical protein
MGVFSKQLRVVIHLSVEEVQRRLATATQDWEGDFRGKAVPPPPWDTGGDFIASQGMGSLWFPVALVVKGTIRAGQDGAMLTAAIRPAGFDVGLMVLGLLAVAGSVLVRGGPLVGAVFLLTSGGLGVALVVWTNVAKKSESIRSLLVSACQGAGR